MPTILSSEHHWRHLNFIRAHLVHDAQHHCPTALASSIPSMQIKVWSARKWYMLLLKEAVSGVTEQSRELSTIAAEGNLSLEENRRGWHSSPLSLMHPFSWPVLTGTECFTDTATVLPLCPRNTDVPTQHGHSTKWAFLFSYCKEQIGFTRLKLEPVSPLPSPLYCTGQKWFWFLWWDNQVKYIKEYLCQNSCSLCILLFFRLIHLFRILTITENQIKTQRHISNGIKKWNSTHSKTLRVYILSNHCLLSLLGTAWCMKLHSSGLTWRSL